MDPEAAVALARAVLVDLDPGEARAISAALQPLLARLRALPDRPAEAAPDACPREEQVLRADVPGPALPQALALAGVPSTTPEGLVRVGSFAGHDVSSRSREAGSS
ncbi:hypothetical protein [Nannocystis punicea]|uniref:Amidase n=1 Tax=Nannocystis punicea TaxID=2995304 RepID=A0ABY7GYH4_9BACT|nr:hypothetical protein [Nannocystis poenicansa]WAS92033.1 hypothetical protein O0S08_38110 [Nannocystis poenicansa]